MAFPSRPTARTPVVIIGAGPVGMVLALDLARYGVDCLLVDRTTSALWYPRGNTHNARTMEHYRRLGLAGAVRETGLPSDHPTDVAYFTSLTGRELQRIPMPSSAKKLAGRRTGGPLEQVPEPLHRSNQMYVERVLRDRVMAEPRISCLFGWEYLEHREDESGVRVDFAPVGGGLRRTCSAGHLVGCDGPRSAVRAALGLSYHGEDAREPGFMSGLTHSTHLRIPGLRDRLPGAPAWQYWVLRPDAVSNFVSLDGEDEFLFHAVRGDDAGDAAVRRLVRDCVGQAVKIDVVGRREWVAGRALVAERYGRGRVQLCGDAVHLFTPTGGFGMNTGIDDAANLAWKLAAVEHGWAGPHLMSSYETERRPIGVRNTRAALDLARGLAGIPLGPELDADSLDGDDARRVAADVLAGFEEEFTSLGVQLGARYEGSPIVALEPGPEPPDEPATYVPTARPGGRVPHVWMPDGSSLFDLLGPGLTLLRLGGARVDVRRLTAEASVRSVPLRVVDVPVQDARELHGRDLVLVRPDQHVAWRGNTVPDDPAGLLARVTGEEPRTLG